MTPGDVAADRDRGRPRWRGVVAAVLAAAAVVALVVGVQAVRPADGPGGAPATEDSADVVPWALRLAPQQDGGAGWPFDDEPSGLPPCRTGSLSVEATEPVSTPGKDGRLPQVRVDLVIRNEGPPCQLEPTAEGDVRDEDGRRLPLASLSIRDQPGYPPPPPLEEGGTASTTLSWSSWCGTDDPGRWTARLLLAGAGLDAEVPGVDPAVPPCAPGSDGAMYDYSRWTILNEWGQPARDPRSALMGTVTGPDSAPLGGVLPMVLRLDNPTRGPVALDPCPSFVWSVSDSGPGSFHAASRPLLLNCPAAPPAVPAGGHVDFALELALSPAIVDGALTPGRWFVTPGLGGAEPRPFTVRPPEPADERDPAPCTWLVPPDAQPRVPGLPPATAARTPHTALLGTNRGEIEVALDAARSPCAVAAVAHLAAGGFYDGQPCYALSVRPAQFRNVDCGASEHAPIRTGFAFPSEARPGQDYPAGTVVLTASDQQPHAGSLRILYGEATTYLDSFVVLGRVTSGLDVVERVAAGGQRDGDYGGPALPLRIERVTVG